MFTTDRSLALVWINVLAVLLFTACSSTPEKAPVEPEETVAQAPPPPYQGELPDDAGFAVQLAQGSIYNSAWNMSLFDDNRARQVGDTIIVKLIESTSASKQSSTSTSKTQDISMPGPTLFGRPVTHKGVEILNNDLENEQSFDGSGSSSQSNSLSGSVVVTVNRVLANGNLVVEGEKLVMINQGEEFVKLEGVVRPSDIETDNSIPSWKVADAKITYGGDGVLADANRMGWLGRFFQSIFSPF